MDLTGFVDYVRLDASTRREILDLLDQEEIGSLSQNATGGKSGGRDRRQSYRLTDVALEIRHPGGSLGRFLVATQNLSAEGIRFVHGGYIHVGSKCRIVLRRNDEINVPIPGRIMKCDHVRGAIHSCIIEFETTINPRSFVSGGQWHHDSGADELMLDGAAVYIHNDSPVWQQLTQPLMARGLDVAVAPTLDLARPLLEERVPGTPIIIDGVGRHDVPPVVQLKALRDEGHQGPIAVIVNGVDGYAISELRLAGASRVISWPVEIRILLEAIRTTISAGQDADISPILSTLDHGPGNDAMILEYIERTFADARELEAAGVTGNVASARPICQALSQTGNQYGFPQLAGVSSDAARILEQNVSTEDIRAILKNIVAVIDRLAVRRSLEDFTNAAA